MPKWYLLLFFTSLNFSAVSQYVIQGKLTDAETGDPIPYAAVLIKGTMRGASTDFEGNYKIVSLVISDSINVTYLGYDSFNKKLSLERAEKVKSHLVSKGVEVDRLSTEGYGEENPIESNATRKGRIANRRVEFKVVE